MRATLGPSGNVDDLREAVAGDLVFHVLTAEPAGDVHLSFRPSDAVISLGGEPTSARNVFRGAVTDIIDLGDRSRVLIDAGQTLAAEVTRDAIRSLDLRPGQPVYVSIKATSIEVYR